MADEARWCSRIGDVVDIVFWFLGNQGGFNLNALVSNVSVKCWFVY